MSLKEKLVLANKIMEAEKLATPFGHISVRIPERETFYITRSISPAAATIGDILICDLGGKIIEGNHSDTYSEVVLHTGVYKKRKEFNCVAHTHSQYVIALSLAGITVLPVNLQALVLGLEPIALYTKMAYIDTPELGEEIADLLGPNRAVILKGHGAVVVGKSIEDTIYAARILETSAMFQWMARTVGTLTLMTDEEKQLLADHHSRAKATGHGSSREWDYYASKLK